MKGGHGGSRELLWSLRSTWLAMVVNEVVKATEIKGMVLRSRRLKWVTRFQRSCYGHGGQGSDTVTQGQETRSQRVKGVDTVTKGQGRDTVTKGQGSRHGHKGSKE